MLLSSTYVNFILQNLKVNESIVESESIVKLNDFMLFMIASPGVVKYGSYKSIVRKLNGSNFEPSQGFRTKKSEPTQGLDT